ncbi:hypothetical protein WISP_34547 [Willisornis vidua]|uniref:Uncharacterized protein n=1 Tax=Willisornis vidua TaxID=1566151 RepID=A0ABQ9DNG6_9PASS|nr:hypothetical protein WISP_34547 [Willisornis vidua]
MHPLGKTPLEEFHGGLSPVLEQGKSVRCPFPEEETLAETMCDETDCRSHFLSPGLLGEEVEIWRQSPGRREGVPHPFPERVYVCFINPDCLQYATDFTTLLHKEDCLHREGSSDCSGHLAQMHATALNTEWTLKDILNILVEM